MDCDHWLHTSWCWTLNLSPGLLLWPGVQCSSWPVIMSRPAKAWRRDDRWSIKSIFTLITDILRIKNVQRFAIQLHFHQFWIFGASLSMKTNAWHLVHSLLTLLPLLTLLHGAWCCEHNISDQMRPSLVSTSRTIALCSRCAWLLYTHTVFTADIRRSWGGWVPRVLCGDLAISCTLQSNTTMDVMIVVQPTSTYEGLLFSWTKDKMPMVIQKSTFSHHSFSLFLTG